MHAYISIFIFDTAQFKFHDQFYNWSTCSTGFEIGYQLNA